MSGQDRSERGTLAYTDWTDARCEQLRGLWLQTTPRLSTAAVGLRMGLTKSSIISKAKRMGLPGRGSPLIVGGTKTATVREARAARVRPGTAITLPSME